MLRILPEDLRKLLAKRPGDRASVLVNMPVNPSQNAQSLSGNASVKLLCLVVVVDEIQVAEPGEGRPPGLGHESRCDLAREVEGEQQSLEGVLSSQSVEAFPAQAPEFERTPPAAERVASLDGAAHCEHDSASAPALMEGEDALGNNVAEGLGFPEHRRNVVPRLTDRA